MPSVLPCLFCLLGFPSLLSGQEGSSGSPADASNSARLSVPSHATSDARLAGPPSPDLRAFVATEAGLSGFVRILQSNRSSEIPRKLEFTASLLRIGQAVFGDAGLAHFGGETSALPRARFGVVTSPGPGVEINASLP